MRWGRQGKPIIVYLLGAALLPLGAYLAFELGRYQSGYSLLDQRRERDAYEFALIERDRTLDDLRRQIALLETSREIDRETYAQVEQNLGQLQERIQAQEEELAFYRGIVSPQDGLSGLRVQEFEVVPGEAERRYLMRLVLVQAIVHNRPVRGTARVQLMGMQDGIELELDLGQLAADEGGAELAYGFRYFQGFERELLLPEGFEPVRFDLEILPSEPRGEPVRRSFAWAAVLG